MRDVVVVSVSEIHRDIAQSAYSDEHSDVCKWTIMTSFTKKPEAFHIWLLQIVSGVTTDLAMRGSEES